MTKKRQEKLQKAFNGNYPNVIVIGGTSGVGKSTIGSALLRKFNVAIIIETGSFTRVLLKLFPGTKLVKQWRDYSDDDPVARGRLLKKRSKFTACFLNELIDDALARRKGTVITGLSILPSDLPIDRIFYCLLINKDKNMHRRRFSRPYAKERRLINLDFQAVNALEKALIKEARRIDAPIIDNSGSVKGTVNAIIRAFSKRI